MKDQNSYYDKRPWGDENWMITPGKDTINANPPSMVKLLNVNPDQSLSLQFHHNRDEYWRVVKGNGIAKIDGNNIPITVNDEIIIKKGQTHQLSSGNEGIQILELAFGDFDEKDIVRIEDKYGRV